MRKKCVLIIIGMLLLLEITLYITPSKGIQREVYNYTYGVDDSYVTNKYPNSNYGLSTNLRIANINGTQYESHIHFNTSNRPQTWIKAEVKLKVKYCEEDTNIVVCLVNSSWEEWWVGGITWNNKPEHGEIISTFAVEKDQESSSSNIEIDISDHIEGDDISICLYASNEGNITFYSDSAWNLLGCWDCGPKIKWTSLETAEINVISPDSYSVYRMGENITIRWTSNGSIERVEIELYRGEANYVSLINFSTENDGEYIWEIPENGYGYDRNDFRIKITDRDDDRVYGYSEYFTIGEVPDDNDVIYITIPLDFIHFVFSFTIVTLIIAIYTMRRKTKINLSIK